jgi:hypothetical protein
MKWWWLIPVLVLLLIWSEVDWRAHSENTPRDSVRPGCFRGSESLPNFVLFRICGKEGSNVDNPFIDRLVAVRKITVNIIEDTKERGIDCTLIGTASGKIMVYGSLEELLIRVQPDHVDYGACQPEWTRFIHDLEGRKIPK